MSHLFSWPSPFNNHRQPSAATLNPQQNVRGVFFSLCSLLRENIGFLPVQLQTGLLPCLLQHPSSGHLQSWIYLIIFDMHPLPRPPSYFAKLDRSRHAMRLRCIHGLFPPSLQRDSSRGTERHNLVTRNSCTELRQTPNACIDSATKVQWLA